MANLEKVLDIGCGDIPHGSVNIDLLKEGSNRAHRAHDFNPRQIPNFVKADAAHLPFKDHSFDYVYCSHLLEHVQDIDLCLEEFGRVARRAIIIRVPCYLFELLSWLIFPWVYAWARKHHVRKFWLTPFPGNPSRINYVNLKSAVLYRKARFTAGPKIPWPFETETWIWKYAA